MSRVVKPRRTSARLEALLDLEAQLTREIESLGRQVRRAQKDVAQVRRAQTPTGNRAVGK